jgi:salicylate hydroxylase
MRAIVIGAGIGGLAAAQGLRRAGIDVVLLERDVELAATGGYRLHLAPAAVQALRTLLTPRGFEMLLASSAGARRFEAAFRDHRGRLLLRAREPQDDLSLDVDRVTLRSVLADGLEDDLRLGALSTGWRVDGDVVHVDLDDGETLQADALVIANGPGSRFARELAGEPTDRLTGFVSITGRTSWSQVSPAGRDFLQHIPQFSVGPDGVALFTTFHDPVGDAAVRSPLARPATTAPTVIWGLVIQQEQLGTELRDRLRSMDHEELVAVAGRLLVDRRWHRPLRDVVAEGEKGSVSAYRLHQSDPDRLAPWPAGRVTAVGDAVHAMPPTGGRGGATAILDAAALAARLASAARGEVTIPVAMEAYEAQMREHAAPAVRESLKPLGWIRAAATPSGATAARLLLPIAAAASAGIRGALDVSSSLRRA